MQTPTLLRAGLTAAAAAALLVPVLSQPASAVYPGANGFLSYSVYDELAGGEDVYRELPDGSQVRRLTTDGTSRQPVFSPDGRTVAYADDGRLAFMMPDGTGKRRTPLPVSYRAQSVSWSPDGTRLAVATPTGVSLVDRTGAVLRRVPVSGVTRVSFHPTDGDRLLVGSRTVLRLSTGRTAVVPVARTAPADRVDPVEWMPDGKRIAFLATCSASGSCTEAKNLYTAPLAGGPRVAVTTRTTASACDPDAGCDTLSRVVPSPDGRDFFLQESFSNGAGTSCVYSLRVHRSTCSGFGESIELGDWQGR